MTSYICATWHDGKQVSVECLCLALEDRSVDGMVVSKSLSFSSHTMLWGWGSACLWPSNAVGKKAGLWAPLPSHTTGHGEKQDPVFLLTA